MERWLDAALRARGDAEPGAGLEDRVLARLASEPQGRRFPLWPVMAAVAAILAVALGLMTWKTSTPQPNLANRNLPPAKQSAGVEETHRMPGMEVATQGDAQQQHVLAAKRAARCCVSTQRVAAASGHARDERLPMLATFPAPSPKTADERLLERLAARRGSFDLAALAKDPATPEALWVPKLEVEPMEGTPPDNPRE